MGATGFDFFLPENRSESRSSQSPAAEGNEAMLVTWHKEKRSILQTQFFIVVWCKERCSPRPGKPYRAVVLRREGTMSFRFVFVPF